MTPGHALPLCARHLGGLGCRICFWSGTQYGFQRILTAWLFFSIQIPYYILWHFEKISLPFRPFSGLTRLSEDSFCDKLGWEKQASHKVTTWQSQFYHHPLPTCLTARQYPAYPPPFPMRSHPAQSGEGFDAPPTLERSGSEHRRAVTSSLFGQERGLVRDVEPSLTVRKDG